MIFRQAALDDLPALLRIDALGREAMLRDAIANKACLLALSDGQPAAFAIQKSDFFGYPFVELLVVDAALRRRGIGLKMLSHLAEACAADRLFTSTNASNEPMQSLLARAGFARCGQIDALDAGDPELVYVKWLK
ncbi:MAG: GNAT family N-acetyltransferase [Oscillospiraceae bacterium]|jgi:ribosomal protein S18 acetylase RimI-like enzyme|nr:GNAT family N-acetyltransferase [Oscillospiraceae bacterium]